jgi:hypothetical protein
VKLAKTFGVPIVHSTVNVGSGQVGPTVPELEGLLDDYPPIDRTTINSWEMERKKFFIGFMALSAALKK